MNPVGKLANLLRLRGRLEAPVFSFLNLGLLAYVGQQEALAQVQTGNIKVRARVIACVCVGVSGGDVVNAPMLTHYTNSLGTHIARRLLVAGGQPPVALRVPRQAGARHSPYITCPVDLRLDSYDASTDQHPNHRQVSTRNRILVLFDWMKTRVFGRDISRW